MYTPKYLLVLLLAVVIPTGVQAQNKTVRELSDLTPVVGDAMEVETAANASGFVSITEILALITPTTFPDPVNTSCELLVFDFTGAVLGFIGSGATGPICINTSGNVSFSAPIARSTIIGITASTTQTQGQQPLTAELNEISVVANSNDTVTLPSAVAGIRIVVINNGGSTLRVFPASGDDLGAGVDTAETITVGQGSRTYFAYDDANWESI